MGLVTQFNIRVVDPDNLESVDAQIDDMFATAQQPTATFTGKAFVGRIADDVIELVSFARWLGLGCLAAMLALIANAIVLSVQGRIAEHAVLQTLGYPSRPIGALLVAEGGVPAWIGGGRADAAER